MTIKTEVSRFHIHDELTAPDPTAPLIKSIQTAGGAVSKFIGVLAESPAALRSYMRLRSELRKGELTQATRERIGLALAERRDDAYTLNQYARTARAAGLGLDEVARAREFTSADKKEAALLELLRSRSNTTSCRQATSSRRRGKPAGQTPRSSRRWPMSLAMFQSIVATAAELPLESSDPASCARPRPEATQRGEAGQPAGVTVAAIGPEPTVRKPSRLAVFFVRSQA